MEKISHNEYTFDHWLKGYPEPDFPFWKYSNSLKLNPVYLEISKAKVFAFDKALEFTLYAEKNYILNKISRFDENRRKKYIQSYLEKAEKNFEGYGVIELIEQIDPNKFDKIDGKAYLQIKKQYEGLQNGTYLVCKTHINDFFEAVLNFELSEFLNGDLNFHSENEVFTPKSKKAEKGEPLAVRYKLLDEFFKGNEQYNKLKVKDKEALLSIILGCHPDTAKDIKNNAVKNIPEGKYITGKALDRFRDLSDKIKKGETY